MAQDVKFSGPRLGYGLLQYAIFEAVAELINLPASQRRAKALWYHYAIGKRANLAVYCRWSFAAPTCVA